MLTHIAADTAEILTKQPEGPVGDLFGAHTKCTSEPCFWLRNHWMLIVAPPTRAGRRLAAAKFTRISAKPGLPKLEIRVQAPGNSVSAPETDPTGSQKAAEAAREFPSCAQRPTTAERFCRPGSNTTRTGPQRTLQHTWTLSAGTRLETPAGDLDVLPGTAPRLPRSRR